MPRKHLFRRLDEAREKTIVWIAGPPGSGKTSLATSYIESREIPSLWYQLDEGDGDPAVFFYYLRLAHQNKNHKASDLPLFTAEYQQQHGLFARRFFEQLCSELNRPHILVFDNYQEVPESAALHGMLANGLDVVPEGVCLMILSRSESPSPFVRLLANDKVRMLTGTDLRLSLDESRKLMRLKNLDRVHGRAIEQIHGKCEGWAAGIVLMVIMKQVRAFEDWIFANTASCREIFDYFAGEVMDRLDEPTKSFLLHTAFLPKIHAETAKRLTGAEDSEERLSELARNQYFTTRSAAGDPIYQYHQLFREFLLVTARLEWPRETIGRVQRKAAVLLEKSGQTEDAAGLLLDARDWHSVTRLVMENARLFVSQGRHKTIRKWIEKIPEHHREKQPWIQYWLGVCKMTEDLTSSRENLKLAYFRFKGSNDKPGLFLAWSGIVESYIFEWGDMHPLDNWIAEIEEVLADHAQFPSDEIEAGVVFGIFSALMYRQPKHPDQLYWAERLENILLKTNDMDMRLAFGSHLIFFYIIWKGEHLKSKVLSNRLESGPSCSENITPLYYIVWRTVAGTLLWHLNDFENSLKNLQEGIEKSEKTGISIGNFMLLTDMVYLSLVQGKVEDAKKYLKSMDFILTTDRFLYITHYYYLQAYLEVCQNNLSFALELNENALSISHKAGSPTLHYFYVSSKADIFISMGKYDQAEPFLNETYKFALETHNQNLKSRCLKLWADLHLLKGDRSHGLEYLRKYLAHSRKYNIVSDTWWRSSVMSRLFVKALEADIEVEHVQRLIREHRIQPDPALGYVENWPYKFRIKTFGGLQVIVDGKPLPVTRKGQKKPLELLKVLIAHGGSEVRVELLADVLWPDSDGDSALQALTTTLYRLRKMLGHEQAILLKGRRLSINPSLCQVDVPSLEHCIRQTSKLMNPNSQDESALMQVADKIHSIFEGPFLEGDDAHWIFGPREGFRQKVIDTFKRIGIFWESRRRWKEAANIYQKALQLDPLAEAAYQGLMRCCGRLGRKADALAVYRRCRSNLKRELSTVPSAETERLRRSFESD